MSMTKTPPTVGFDDGAVSEEVDPAAPAKRRIFSAEQKRQILAEYEATTESGAKGALLRREGIYSIHISEWHKVRGSGSLAGLGGHLRSRCESECTENAQLQRKVDRFEAELKTTKVALDIMGGKHTRSWSCSGSARTTTSRLRVDDGQP